MVSRIGKSGKSGIQSMTSASRFRLPSNLSKRSSHASGNGDTFPGASCTSNMYSAHAIFQRNQQLADRRQSNLAGHDNVYGEDFTAAILDEIDQEAAEHDCWRTRLRSLLAHIILNHRFEMCIGVLILSNFVVIALETDARARRDNAAHDDSQRRSAERMLLVITIAHLIYLSAYTLECTVRMYVLRWEFFNHRWNIFDLVIVAVGILAELLNVVYMHDSSLEGLDGLRTLRTLRMLRATRVLVSFDELYSLISGLTHAMKALMWAGILMLMVLTMWSIIAVEYVKPLMSEVASKNGFGTCTWCPSAFDNIFLSNLTFFQIISGDGWSPVARPLIEEYAWTALLFIAVIFSMVFGLLNLIVAVIVDSAAQAREADIMTVAARKDAARAAAWDCFNDMVGELDKDGDGEISVEELRKGLIGGDQFGNLGAYLTTMGIELTDLDMVFELLDSDGDGAVTHEEFTHQLYQMKTQELPITLCYVRNSVSQLHNELDRVSEAIQTKLDKMLRPPAQDMVSNRQMPETPSGTFLPAVNVASSHEMPEMASSTGPPPVMPTLSGKIGGRVSRFQSIADNGEMGATETGGRQKRERVSLFVGKPPPTLRLPKTLEKRQTLQTGNIGVVPAAQVGHPSTSMKDRPSFIATGASEPKKDINSNSQFSSLLSLNEEEEEGK